ncbi:NEQ295 [Nanoarchaeum equitans Kin4-M]|uniref:NEQ295 n=1 Tax=Nanoarchaeum equitans (strain Kin4-M) TaxID=228908 RepID=Q74NH1_NANEQ|nr:NEQ295 [Nanoarchaeum equitans Kin4-M]
MLDRYKFIPKYNDFLRLLNQKRPLFIRVNTLRGDEEFIVKMLENRGFELESTPLKYFYKIKKAPFHLQALPEYILGLIYIQNPSSALPVFALSPRKKDIILDMAAAPGGKSSLIQQLTNNQSILYSVEKDPFRAKKMRFIFDRLNVRAVIINEDALKLPFKEEFKKILLDAPCSANPYIDKTFISKTIEDFINRQTIQKQLIKKAYEMLKPNGILVYSTCTLEPLENEFVIEYALSLGFKIVNANLFGEPALTSFENHEFPKEMQYCKRIYPHIHYGFEPFFYCVLKKPK